MNKNSKIHYRLIAFVVLIAMLLTIVPGEAIAIKFPDSTTNTNKEDKKTEISVLNNIQNSLLVERSSVDYSFTSAVNSTNEIDNKTYDGNSETTKLPGFLVNKIFEEIVASYVDNDIAIIIYGAMLDFEGDKDELKELTKKIIKLLSQTNVYYKNLTNEERLILCTYFDISDSIYSYSDKETIQKTIRIYHKLRLSGLTNEEISDIFYNNTRDEKLKEITNEEERTDDIDNNIITTTSGDDPFSEMDNNLLNTYSAPFNHTKNANEVINLSSGTLQYHVTDVEIPGVNKLNLVVERQYCTDEANYYHTGAYLTYSTDQGNTYSTAGVTISGYDYYFDINEDGTIGDIAYTNAASVITSYFTRYLSYHYTHNEILKNEDNFYATEYNNNTLRNITPYMNASQSTYPITYNDEIWQIGTGWRFNFSCIETNEENSNIKTLHLSDGRKFNLTENWINNLAYYSYDDVSFKIETNTIGELTSEYTVNYADGKKEYFDASGRLIAIVDRYNSAITFKYTTVNHMIEVEITDTQGQVTSIYNVITDEGYNKVVELPDGKTITYVIEKNNERSQFEEYEDYEGEYNQYNLIKVINQEGEETSYSYADIMSYANFDARFEMGPNDVFMDAGHNNEYYYVNYYAALNEISYPTGLVTHYEYYRRWNQWYDYGCIMDIAIKARYEQQDNNIFNQKEYSYSYRYINDAGEPTNNLYFADHYYSTLSPDCISDFAYYLGNYAVSEIDIDRNITVHYAFNNIGQLFSTYTYFNDTLTEKKTCSYRRYNRIIHPSITISTTTVYNSSEGEELTTTECYEYDGKGNNIHYWPVLSEGNTADEEYVIDMTYTSAYNLLTSKTYKKDEATTIYEQYIPTTDEKSIEQKRIYENDNLVTRIDYAYDAYGNVIQKIEYADILNTSNGIETEYTYSNGAYLTVMKVNDIVDADGTIVGDISEFATYDIYGNITSRTDANGYITTYTYDDIGRITQIVNPDNSTKQYTYNVALSQTLETDELGYQTLYQYDKAGNLLGVYSVNAAGLNTLLKSYQYDGVLRVATESNNQDTNGKTINYTYDYKDQVTNKSTYNSSNALLAQETNTYYADKTIKTIIGDANSPSIITTDYIDKYGRITQKGQTTENGEIFTTYTYNYLGKPLQEKSFRANAEGYSEDYTIKYEYDYNNNITKQYDVLGNYTTAEYDAIGRKITLTDARSNANGGIYSIEYTYDSLGRLIKEVTPFTASSSSVKKYYYDANGNITTELCRNNLPGATESYSKTVYVYNNRNELLQTLSHDNGEVADQVDYEYDAKGNMTAIVTGGGAERTEYTYNRYGNLISVTDPKGFVETYTYDLNGNKTSMADKNGNTTSYSYDGLSHMLSRSVTIDGVTQTETMGYTLTGNLAYMENATLRTEFTYDELGRVIAETDSDGVVKTYTYDANGNRLTSVTSVDGVTKKSMSYVYDKKDRMSQVFENGSLIAAYTYDENGNRSSLACGNGVTTTYGYNLANLVTSLANMNGTTTLSSYTYTYYLDGNQATKLDHNSRQTTYTYDGLGRLTREAESGSPDAITKVYAFDAAGNRASMMVSGAEDYTVNYIYDLDNRLLTETKSMGNIVNLTDYHYDNNGNTIAVTTGVLSAINGIEAYELYSGVSGAELYTYDGFNRQTAVQNENGISNYTYRTDGLRYSKTVGGVTSKFVWEGQNISLELDDSGNVVDVYARGIGLIKSDDNGWYLYNAHGDVVQLTSDSGAVTKEYNYDAFGNERNIDSNDTNPFRYCGEYYDKETGTYYLRARYYNPAIGRFLSADSVLHNTYKMPNGQEIIDPLSLNLYTYAGNNPILYSDPSGHIFLLITAAIGLVLGIAGGAIYSYATTGSVTWQSILIGGLIGGFVGLTGGAVASLFATAGSATGITALASTNTVLSGLGIIGGTTAGGGTIVIGQTMSRVIEKAESIGASVYNGCAYYQRLSDMFGSKVASFIGKADNALWIINKMAQNYKIVDIGVNVNEALGNSSYFLESILTFFYKNKEIAIEFFKGAF